MSREGVKIIGSSAGGVVRATWELDRALGVVLGPVLRAS